MEIKQAIYRSIPGSFEAKLVASTAKPIARSQNGEDLFYGIKLKKEYSSLIVTRPDKEESLQVILAQGDYACVNEGGRIADTHTVFNIDELSLRKEEFKIGSIIHSLPGINDWNNRLLSEDLPSKIKVKAPQPHDKRLTATLRGLIIKAITTKKRLLIRLNEPNHSWTIDAILTNEIAQTLFAAIDSLPQEFRPLATFALSVDENYQLYLGNALIILYQGGTKGFGFRDSVELEWTDMIGLDFDLPESDYASFLPLIRLFSSAYSKNAGTDLFHTNLSSREMLSEFHEMRNSIEELEQQKRISQVARTATLQRLYCDQVISQMAIHPIASVDLVCDIELTDRRYSIQQKKNLINNYYSTFKRLNERMKGFAQCCLEEELRAILNSNCYDLSVQLNNYPFFTHEEIARYFIALLREFVRNLILNNIILKLSNLVNTEEAFRDIFFERIEVIFSNKGAAVGLQQWMDLARLCSSEYQERVLTRYASSRNDLNFFGELFKDKEYERIAPLVETAFTHWKGWEELSNEQVDQLSQPPFLEHLSNATKQHLRTLKFNQWEKYHELFAKITYEEIAEIFDQKEREEIGIESLLGLLTNEGKKKFAGHYAPFLEEKLKQLLPSEEEITKSSVWQLYQYKKNAKLEVSLHDNIFRAIDNIYRLRKEGVSVVCDFTTLYADCESLAIAKEVCEYILQKGKDYNDAPNAEAIEKLVERFSDDVDELVLFFSWMIKRKIAIPIDSYLKIASLSSKCKTAESVTLLVKLMRLLNIGVNAKEFEPVITSLIRSGDRQELKRLEKLFNERGMESLLALYREKEREQRPESSIEEQEVITPTPVKEKSDVPSGWIDSPTTETKRESSVRSYESKYGKKKEKPDYIEELYTRDPNQLRALFNALITACVVLIITSISIWSYYAIKVNQQSYAEDTGVVLEDILPLEEIPQVVEERKTPSSIISNQESETANSGKEGGVLDMYIRNGAGGRKVQIPFSRRPLKIDMSAFASGLGNGRTIIDSITYGGRSLFSASYAIEDIGDMGGFLLLLKTKLATPVRIYTNGKRVYKNEINIHELSALAKECGANPVDSFSIGNECFPVINPSFRGNEKAMTNPQYMAWIIAQIQNKLTNK